MTHLEIDTLIQEASKHFLDDSHQAIGSKLQSSLTSEYRSAYDGSDWKDYPQVHHVFGDEKKGTVVYKQGETHQRAPYKKMDNGGYSIGEPEEVQLAYVPSQSSVAEAFSGITSISMGDVKLSPNRLVDIMERFVSTSERKSMPEEDFAGKDKSFPINKPADVRAALASIGRAGGGNHSPQELKSRILAIAKRKGFAVPDSDKKESAPLAAKELEEIVVLQEAQVDSKGNALIKLISPGTGSMGHYPAKVLKEAADKGVFKEGTRMFMDHQTAAERAARPEGDVKKWVATTTKDAEYLEGAKAPDGDGLYAHARVYSDYIPFIKERAKDIGVSVRAGVGLSGNTVNGVPEVSEMKYAISADFVTHAGRGGKVIEMYESFRSSQAGTGEIPRSNEAMTEQEIKDFKLLQESNAKLLTRLDRQEERNNKLEAQVIISEALNGSGLSARGAARVTAEVLAILPLKDGILDTVKVKEAATKAITDEVAYLQESGVRVSPFVIRNAGGERPFSNDEIKHQTEELSESEKILDTAIGSLMGRKPETKKEGAA